MKYNFLLAGTTSEPPPVPVSSRNIFLAVADAPLVISRVSVPPVQTWVVYPEIACSSKVPRLVLVVDPQLPAWSPAPISSRARLVE